MLASPGTLVNLSLAGVALYFLKRVVLARRTAPYPPGPPGWPVIGNLLQYPKEEEWNTFARWAEEYGDMVMVKMFNQRVLLINSPKVAADILDKKSAIYSERPVMPMCGEMGGWTRVVAFAKYGDMWRELRRLLHGVISSKASLANLGHVEELQTRRFLLRVMENGGATLLPDIQSLAAGIMLKISYGYDVIGGAEDPFVKLIDDALEDVLRAAVPGAYIVDVLPFLRFLPDWFPGVGFKREAREIRRRLDLAIDRPYEWVKEHMAAGTASASLASMQIEAGLSDDFIKVLAFQIYIGGSDTTVSTEYCFYLAMTLHPEVQERAQAELDAVVGRDRFPTLFDREQLPYVDAIAKEVLRWMPVSPQGLPHMLKADDVHEGYFIPKGTMCIANIWGLLHNPEIYKDPTAFNPARFIGAPGHPAEQDPRTFAFGFGRRVCPGLQLGDTSVFVAIAMVLAVFTIKPPVDSEGVPVVPKMAFTSGIGSKPLPFGCDIKARDARAEGLVREIKDQY